MADSIQGRLFTALPMLNLVECDGRARTEETRDLDF